MLHLLPAALCLLLATGCGKDRPWAIGQAAPSISVLDLQDQTVKLSSFRGKVVVLRFWTAGCSACAEGMSALDRCSSGYRKKGLVVLAVNKGNAKPEVEALARELKLSYPVFLDPALIASQKYGAVTMPTTYFIDPRGVARKVVEGELSPEQFDQAVADLW